jgi:hypothetical protein
MKTWFKLGISPEPSDSFERMRSPELIGLVRQLIGEMGRVRAEYEKLSGAFARCGSRTRR